MICTSSTVCIITSVIYHVNRPLSYHSTRSVYSPEERALQTISTIESIRSKLPDAVICLVEMGMQRELPFGLHRMADHYMYVGDDYLVRRSCDSIYKGLGETVGLLKVSSRLRSMGDLYYKISGRYRLNENFVPLENLSAKFYVRMYEHSMSTRLYAFPVIIFKKWQRTLLFSIPSLLRNTSLEVVMPKRIGAWHLHLLSTLGVEGELAINGMLLEE